MLKPINQNKQSSHEIKQKIVEKESGFIISELVAGSHEQDAKGESLIWSRNLKNFVPVLPEWLGLG